MPQHKGAVRRVRLSEKRRSENKGQKVELRKLLKDFQATEAKTPEQVKGLQSKLDRLASKGLVHKNFAANKKSQIARAAAVAK
jgi:small subunit ribosomal protein S20